MTIPTILLHFDYAGELTYMVNGDARLIIVDERAPNDRVYCDATQTPLAEIEAIIGSSPIGSANDARHPALAARINAVIDGKPLLTVVEADA